MDMGALGRFEPSLAAVKIPRCPICGAANPKAETHCPVCREPAPPVGETQIECSIATNLDGFVPWHARVLLWIGAQLKRLALRLKGD
jgi:hypothetical protein